MKKSLVFTTILTLHLTTIWSMQTQKLDIITTDQQIIPNALNKNIVNFLNIAQNQKIQALQTSQIALPLTFQEWNLAKKYLNSTVSKLPNPHPKYLSTAAMLIHNDYKDLVINTQDLQILKAIALGQLFITTNLINDVNQAATSLGITLQF